MNTLKIELCVASMEALKAASDMGFDRIELCSNLEQGGMTPSAGFIKEACDLNLNTHVLVRPRMGGFVYSRAEVDLILSEVEQIKTLPVQGIVIGALDRTMRIDRITMLEIKQVWDDRDLTFHRAFDDLIEWKSELTWLIDQGFTRVLSSGLSRSLENGMVNLNEMRQWASDRIEIMVGGGVNASNLPQVLEKVRPHAIHFSGTSRVETDPDSLFSETRLMFDREKAQKMLDYCRNYPK